ncbi:MAG: tetratricopeptide repeat protein [Saprospiraceae bacterium]|nr:tetratricopeptide repeat protein [Saprospiraceae bacterium]
MKIVSIFISLFFFVINISFGQTKSPKTYALVIGVSVYQDPKITSLKHAHKDAEAFAEFCLSASGLNMAAEQLKVLINEKASYWDIVSGLEWLKTNAKRDDQIYIYFAGHGDMESKVLQYGYLLANDSRYMNYIGRSLSLDDLNKTAHTLSVEREAQVFLITDACHSGKLAGVDFDGSNLVLLELKQVVDDNEVRMTSCDEQQLSYEDKIWGDGRGAFSYFLTRGMSGEADGVDGTKDGNITIGEIKSFLNRNVPEVVLKVKKKNQNPVVKGGTNGTILNSYKASAGTQNVTTAKQTSNEISTDTGSRSVSAEPNNEREEDIRNTTISKARDQNTDFKILSSKPVSEIVNVLLHSLIKEKEYDKKTLSSVPSQQVVAKALYNLVQEIIDLYLSADETELEKREYYKQIDKPYDQYPYMLDIAIKLLPKDHLIIPSLKMQRAYMSGLNARLKAPFKGNFKAQIDTAIIYQEKALSIDSSAAYIHNELGVLNSLNGRLDTAISYYERANSIAPLWPIPYSNLANAYYIKKDFVKAKEYVDTAFQKQENLPTPYIIDGNLYTIKSNYLYAEEQYQRAIKINSYNFVPFDRLGDVYLKLQDYQTAEKYYQDATKRKAVLESIDEEVMNILPLIKSIVPNKILSPPDTTKLSNDVISCFVFGKIHFDKKEDIEAKKWFEKVVILDPENPMVYQYLGQIASDSEEYGLSEYYFNLAIKFHLQESLLFDHIRNVTKGVTLHEDVLKYYEASNFDIYKPNLSLARTYEKWNHYHFAMQQYQKCIELKPTEKAAYIQLWKLYQSQMELESAETVIHKFGQVYPDELDEALGEHYEWALSKYTEDVQKTAHYAYKYGLLMHKYVMKQPKEIFTGLAQSKTNEELVIQQKIKKYLTKGIEMLEIVESATIDKFIKTDVFTKLGDLYLHSHKHEKALEYYESYLNFQEDNHSIRSLAAKCADHEYLFKKALSHLTTLEQSNSLKYEDAIILAKYYMKNGEKEKSITLYEKIANTHPFLKKEIENDIIKLHLRFGDYQKAIELIYKCKESNKTDMNLEYMLARANAGLNKPDEALEHLQNAESMGFHYGFVYKNDDNFDPYRTTSDWQTINSKMNQYIETKMAASKKQP